MNHGHYHGDFDGFSFLIRGKQEISSILDRTGGGDAPVPSGSQTLRYNGTGTPKIDALVNCIVYPHWSHGPKMKKACTLGHYQLRSWPLGRQQLDTHKYLKWV